MNIEKIEIENFRSIREKLHIYSDPNELLVFAGANNSGKSNI